MIFAEFIIIFNTLLKIMEMIMIPYTDVKKLCIFWRHASDSYKNISTLRLLAQCIPPPPPSVDIFNTFKHFLILLADKEI